MLPPPMDSFLQNAPNSQSTECRGIRWPLQWPVKSTADSLDRGTVGWGSVLLEREEVAASEWLAGGLLLTVDVGNRGL